MLKEPLVVELPARPRKKLPLPPLVLPTLVSCEALTTKLPILRLVSPAPLPVKLAALMVPALKFPLPSRLTRVPTVLRLVAVSPALPPH